MATGQTYAKYITRSVRALLWRALLAAAHTHTKTSTKHPPDRTTPEYTSNTIIQNLSLPCFAIFRRKRKFAITRWCARQSVASRSSIPNSYQTRSQTRTKHLASVARRGPHPHPNFHQTSNNKKVIMRNNKNMKLRKIIIK